jgi:hypothetical protein
MKRPLCNTPPPIAFVLLLSVLALLPGPALAATGLAGGQPAAVTYPLAGTTGISVFATDRAGGLVERRWNGTSWNWVRHGAPAGHSILSPPTAVAWNDGANLRFNLFFLVEDGVLAERRFNGAHWRWVVHGAPPGAPPGARLLSSPTMIQWISPEALPRFNVFAVGSDHRLYERWFNGGSWFWAYHDPPAGPGLVSGETPAISAWQLDSSVIAISILLRRGDGSVIERYYVEGIGWRWRVLGTPPGSRVNRALAIASWRRADGNRELLGLGGGPDQNMYQLTGVREPSGETAWSWQNAGPPPGGNLRTAPTVVAWRGPTADRWSAFANGFGRIVELWSDGALHWSDRGIPPGGPLTNSRPGLVAWRQGTKQRLDLFTIGALAPPGRLINYSFDGSGWRWIDHGLSP